MQFSILSVFALAVAVSAASLSQNEGFVVVKRQAQGAEVPVNSPAMTNAAGEVLPFDSTKVYLDAAANGQ